MNSKIMSIFKWIFTAAVILLLWVPSGYSQTAMNEFSGHEYKVFIYGRGISDSSITISFNENLTFLIDKYEGVGAYIPFGGGFAGVFSTPNYNKTEKSLLLMFTGFRLADFIFGTGSSFMDFEFVEFLFFSGYLK